MRRRTGGRWAGREKSRVVNRLFSLLLCAVALSLGGVWCYQRNFAYHHLAGREIAPDAPVQTEAIGVKKWSRDGYLIEPLARFEMTGRVVLTDRFWSGREADLSPVDLTLAWGPRSDTGLLEKISFYKMGRYARYEWDDMSIKPDTIAHHSANMHMIAADSEVARKLKSIHREDLVTFSGYLVSVQATDGWSWKSSTSRTDEGNGACELVWVEKIASR